MVKLSYMVPFEPKWIIPSGVQSIILELSLCSSLVIFSQVEPHKRSLTQLGLVDLHPNFGLGSNLDCLGL